MYFFACLVSCLLVMASLTSVQADYCGYRYGKSWYCPKSNQYCCGFDGLTALCCTYTSNPFYKYWYLWIIIAIALFSAIFAYCRRRRMRRQLQASTTAGIQSHNFVQGLGQQQPTGFVNSTAPPTANVHPTYPMVASARQNTLPQPTPPYNSQNYFPQTGKDVKENLNNVQ